MKSKKITLIIMLAIVIINLVSCKSINNNSKRHENLPSETLTKEKSDDNALQEYDINLKEEIKKMSVDDKIGQLFILGFNGLELGEDLESIIKNDKISGLVYFDRNIKSLDQLKKLNKDITSLNDKYNGIEMFLAVDEESERVSRLSKIYGNLQTMEYIGNISSKNTSFEYGELLGVRLNHLGFNLDFAPVVDINSNPNNPVIGDRSLGNNYKVVVDNYFEIVKGLNSKNVISCIKHFPGHGDTSIDSHFEVPIINKSKEELYNMELKPFIDAIENDIEMIMIGHLMIPSLDDKIASISDEIMIELLRKKLGFEGVIISDDLNMQAVTDSIENKNAAYEFLINGGDLALICHDISIYYEAKEMLKQQIGLGNISESLIDDKVYRILKLKNSYNSLNNKLDAYSDEYIIDLGKELLK